MKIEFKKYTIADCNAITNFVVKVAFNNGEYSPVNADFFKKVYTYFMVSNILDNYITKDENDNLVISDVDELYKYIYSDEIDEIIKNDENKWKFIKITDFYFEMIEDKIEYIKQQNLSNKNTLTDISLSNLIDTINKVVESFENSITSDDVKKLIESKDDIVKALTDKDRLDKRLEEYEKRHSKQDDVIKDIEETLKKRADKVE